jgi:hypothetical protein
MVSLGNHPEVTLCTSCARWVAKRAGEVDDLTRTGPLVLLKDRMRLARRRVIERGWHRRAVVGRPLRWLGRLLP